MRPSPTTSAYSLRPGPSWRPGGSGFDLLEQLDELPRVVSTTACADQVVRSFDCDSVDYLLTPVEPELPSLFQASVTSLPPSRLMSPVLKRLARP